MEVTKDLDVVIIGAGPSGFCAANELQKLTNGSVDFLILEAKDRIGGRTFSKKLPSANGEEWFDFGGQWASNSQKYLLKLLEEFNCELHPQYSTGDRTLMVNNLSDIRTYSGTIPKLGILELLDVNRFLNKVEKMWKQLHVEEPSQCQHAGEWDSMTVESFVQASCRFEASRNVMATATRALFGREPSQVSLFYFLYFCAQAGGLDPLLETRKGAQEFVVKGSMGQVFHKIREKIGKDRVICNDPVVAIDQSNESSVIVKTEKGCTYSAKYVISAIPPLYVNKIRFTPQLPLNRRRLGETMLMGNYIKCIATFDIDFWRSKGSCAEATVIVNKRSAGPLVATFDDTSPNGAPAILCFIGGEHALIWSSKTQEERKEAVIECLAGMFGEEAKTSLIHYEDKDWSNEPYTGGCPAAVMIPGGLSYFHHALREPFDRVHWAGTETATEWTGYIEGALQAGHRVSKEIGERMKSPSTYPPSKLEEPPPLLPRNNTWSATNGRKSFLSSLFS